MTGPIRLRVPRVAGPECGHLGGELPGELLGHRTVHQDPVGRHADLPLVQEAAEDGGPDRVVDVGALQHHQGAVAAQFEDGPLKAPAAVAAMCRPTRSEPVNRNHLGHGVLDERVAYLGAVGDHHVEQPGRKSGVLEYLRYQTAADDRGVLMGFHDDRVAERQCGCDGLHRHQEREVEGADDPDDADGQPVEPVLPAVPHGRQQTSGGAQCLADRLAQELGGAVDLVPCARPGAAQFVDDRLGDLLGALAGDTERAFEDGSPLVRVDRGPLLLRPLGGPVGAVDLQRGGHGDGGEFLTVVGIEIDDVPRAAAGQPLAVDVLVGQFMEEGHAIPYCRRSQTPDATSS